MNKELKECKSKAASLLQAQIRGYLARLKFKQMTMERNEMQSVKPMMVKNQVSNLMTGGSSNLPSSQQNNNNNNNNMNAQNRINYDLLIKSAKTIQSYWRGYAIRKLYRDLRLDMATKAMQFGYFCEQVCIYLILK